MTEKQKLETRKKGLEFDNQEMLKRIKVNKEYIKHIEKLIEEMK